MRHLAGKISRRYRRWRVKRSARLLDEIDQAMTASGYGRQQRRSFWHEFRTIPSARIQLFERLMECKRPAAQK